MTEYSARANETVAVIVQAEHRDAVKEIRNIVKVEGLDGVLIGPYDLASSLGRTGEVDHPEVRAAIDTVRAARLDAKMPVGILGLTAEGLTPYIDQGFTLIIAGVDVLLLGESFRTLLRGVRRSS
jgi:2-keto-3-deoxy-L-rhamnonate aldolase RhmA